MAGLPPISRVLLPELEGGGGLRRRNPGLQLAAVYRPQGRLVRVQPLLQKVVEGKSFVFPVRICEIRLI